MKVGAVIQARMSSTRLPGKVLLNVGQRPLLHQIILRLEAAKLLDTIIVATSTSTPDDEIEEWCHAKGVSVFRGSEENVLQRYYECAKAFQLDIIVRVTADDPFKDPQIIDQLVDRIKSDNYDFVCNNKPVSFPEGLDVEIMTFPVLEESYKNAESDFEKEHVTQYVHRRWNSFKTYNLGSDENNASKRWTIDTQEDLDFAREVYKELESSGIFMAEDILSLLKSKPQLELINNEVSRSTLYSKSKNSSNE